MYGILAEAVSDVDTLKVLIRQLAGDQTISIRGKGFGSCGDLLKKGSNCLKEFSNSGCSRFIIAHDADQRKPKEVMSGLIGKIVKPSGVKSSICLLVPVQEIEAWLLADLEAVSNIIPSWKPESETNPESKPEPKEYLERLSRDANSRPRYRHTIHNPKLAEKINLEKVSKCCPSFRPLEAFVKHGRGNY